MSNNYINYEFMTDRSKYNIIDSKYNKLIDYPLYNTLIPIYLKKNNSKWSNINIIKKIFILCYK